MMNSINTSQNETKVSVQLLNGGFCHLIDFTPNNNGVDCSISDPTKCILCTTTGAYFTGESVNDYGSTALKYHYAIWILILAVSLFGLLNNILILMVMKMRKNFNSFDIFLIVLAGFDAFSSLLTISASTSCAAYFGNWFGRGRIMIYWYYLSLYSSFLGRSGSTITTVVITIERFLMITFPFKANSWFTLRKTNVLVFLILFIVGMLSFPRYVSYSVEYNEYQDIPSIQGMEYILKVTPIGNFFYNKLDALHNQIDFWMPLPIIVLLNILSFWKVRQITKKRKEISANVKREIRAIKMFLPVAIVYFMTNIGPIMFYILIQFDRRVYREMMQVLLLSIALNSVANLPIYYWSSSIFRTEFKQVIGYLWPRGSNDGFQLCDKTPNTTVNTSLSSESNKN